MDRTVTYASRIDCTANRCPKPHADDGQIVPHVFDEDPPPTHINGHRVTTVMRTITISDWAEVAT